MIEREIKQIIKDYKEALEEASSEYERRTLKMSAFDEILKVVETDEQADAERRAEVEAEKRALIEEERLLDPKDGTLAGRWHE